MSYATDLHAPALRTSQFRFYEELNDFLPPDRRKTSFAHAFRGTPSVKDTIEAMGVPHTEIDLILVDGRSVGFDYRLAQRSRECGSCGRIHWRGSHLHRLDAVVARAGLAALPAAGLHAPEHKDVQAGHNILSKR